MVDAIAILLLAAYAIGVILTLISGVHSLFLARDSMSKGFDGLAAREAAEGRRHILGCFMWPRLAADAMREGWRL